MINNDAVVRTNYHKYFHPKVGDQGVMTSVPVVGRSSGELRGLCM